MRKRDGSTVVKHSASARPTFDAIATAALAAAALLAVLKPLSIALPAARLDDSWIAVLGQAATWPARWGVDLLFTYGPASALLTRFYTDAYLGTALPILVAVAIANGYCFARLVGVGLAGRRNSTVPAVLAVAAAIVAVATQANQDQDGFYFAFSLIVYLLDLARPCRDRASRAGVVAGTVLMGGLALSKSSYGVLSVLLFALADARALLARRRWPLLTPVFLVASLVTFLCYGQRLTDLPVFLRVQGDIMAGYAEAMYLVAGRGETFGFLACCAVLVGAAVASQLRGLGRVFAVLGVAATLAVAFKAGFIRADEHTQIAWAVLGLAGLVVAAGLVLPRSILAAGVLGTLSLAVLSIVAPLFLLAGSGRAPDRAGLVETYADWSAAMTAEASGWRRFLRDPAGFAAEARLGKDAAWAAIRAAHPLPKLAGRVDVIPSVQSHLLANGLDYHPRPSFQDYASYTAGLIAANAAFYAGTDAPDWVLFGIGGFDERYSNTSEGALWPELLRRYEPVRRVGKLLALQRRAQPLPEVLGDARLIETRLGKPIALGAIGPVFTRIAVHKTLLGRLAALLFRPPTLSLRVKFASGEEGTYRFIPAMAKAGFLLSPMIDDAVGFARLGFGEGNELGGHSVIEATVGGSRVAELFYDRDVSVELRPMTLQDVRPSAEARPLYDELESSRPWRDLVRRVGHGADLHDDRLAANAPTALAIPTADARRLHLGFGIEDDTWTEGRTQGVCFAVKAGPDASAALWRRCLDPRDAPADRGPQNADLDLPPGLAAVTVETTCPRSCDWGWSYWNDIKPET